jgi:hypothetical protein
MPRPCPRTKHLTGASSTPQPLDSSPASRNTGSPAFAGDDCGRGSGHLRLVIARSEATKQSRIPPWKESGLLRRACHRAALRADPGLAMTECEAPACPSDSHFERRHTFAFSRRVSPELCIIASPSEIKGRREDRAPAGTRGPLRAKCAGENCTAAYRLSRKRPAFPAQWLERLMSCSPRGDELCCPRSPADD